MMRVLAGVVATFAVVLAPLLTNAQDRQPQLEPPDPHGAVLCAWQIYLVAAEVGEMCFPGEDAPLKEVLRESIDEMDAFIIANGPATADQIAEAKRRVHEMTGLSQLIARAREREPGTPICRSEAFRDVVDFVYERMRKQDTQTLRSEIAQLLAVPRKPVLSPCL
jgi:hypothetical protein